MDFGKHFTGFQSESIPRLAMVSSSTLLKIVCCISIVVSSPSPLLQYDDKHILLQETIPVGHKPQDFHSHQREGEGAAGPLGSSVLYRKVNNDLTNSVKIYIKTSVEEKQFNKIYHDDSRLTPVQGLGHTMKAGHRTRDTFQQNDVHVSYLKDTGNILDLSGISSKHQDSGKTLELPTSMAMSQIRSGSRTHPWQQDAQRHSADQRKSARTLKRHVLLRHARSFHKTQRWSVKVGSDLLRDFQLGIMRSESCRDVRHDLEQTIDYLRKIYDACQVLEDKLSLRTVISRHRVMDIFSGAVSRVMNAVHVMTQFSIFHANCMFHPVEIADNLTYDVLKGNRLDKDLTASLTAIHEMILGSPAYLGNMSVLSLYEKRSHSSQKQSKKWFVNGFFEYLTLLQAAGYAVHYACDNFNKSLLDTKPSDQPLKTFTRLVEEQEKTLRNLRLRDFFVNTDTEGFFTFSAKRDIDEDKAIHVDEGVVGYDPSAEYTPEVGRTLVQIKGCQLSHQWEALSLRCSVRKHPMCGNTMEGRHDDVFSHDLFENTLTSDKVLRTENCENSCDYYVKNLTCVSTRWVKTSRHDQTACAVRLRVIPGPAKCLGLDVYFCSVNSCNTAYHEGWAYSGMTSSGRRKKRKVPNVTKTWDWSQAGYSVDSHMTLPEYSGSVTGVRLYDKNGHLAIGLRTTFQ